MLDIQDEFECFWMLFKPEMNFALKNYYKINLTINETQVENPIMEILSNNFLKIFPNHKNQSANLTIRVSFENNLVDKDNIKGYNLPPLQFNKHLMNYSKLTTDPSNTQTNFIDKINEFVNAHNQTFQKILLPLNLLFFGAFHNYFFLLFSKLTLFSFNINQDTGPVQSGVL